MAKLEETENSRDARANMYRSIKAVSRFGVTLIVIVSAVLAVQFGASELSRRADAAPSPEPARVTPVSTSSAILEQRYTVNRAFVGQVEPQKTASASFELPGHLADIFVDEGDPVTKGQVLAAQDTSLLEAERAQLIASKTATRAQLRFARQTAERNKALNTQGFTSQARLEEAEARQDELTAKIAEIDAGLDNVAIRIGKSQLKAAFDGRITKRLVDGGETLGAGQPVLGLVEVAEPRVRIGVPLDIDAAKLADASIETNGKVFAARLVSLRPDIDAVTRTRTALFEINGTDQLTFGQTARLIVSEQIEAEGIWVPMTSLKEGARGQWTLLTVGPQGIVRDATVEILHAETARVFVRGAFPEGTLLIDEGPQRVTVGQRVKPSQQQ